MKYIFYFLDGIFLGLFISGVVWTIVNPVMDYFGPFRNMVQFTIDNKVLTLIGFLVCKIGEKVYSR